MAKGSKKKAPLSIGLGLGFKPGQKEEKMTAKGKMRLVVYEGAVKRTPADQVEKQLIQQGASDAFLKMYRRKVQGVRSGEVTVPSYFKYWGKSLLPARKIEQDVLALSSDLVGGNTGTSSALTTTDTDLELDGGKITPEEIEERKQIEFGGAMAAVAGATRRKFDRNVRGKEGIGPLTAEDLDNTESQIELAVKSHVMSPEEAKDARERLHTLRVGVANAAVESTMEALDEINQRVGHLLRDASKRKRSEEVGPLKGRRIEEDQGEEEAGGGEIVIHEGPRQASERLKSLRKAQDRRVEARQGVNLDKPLDLRGAVAAAGAPQEQLLAIEGPSADGPVPSSTSDSALAVSPDTGAAPPPSDRLVTPPPGVPRPREDDASADNRPSKRRMMNLAEDTSQLQGGEIEQMEGVEESKSVEPDDVVFRDAHRVPVDSPKDFAAEARGAPRLPGVSGGGVDDGGETVGVEGADGRDDFPSPDELDTLKSKGFQWTTANTQYKTLDERGKIGYGTRADVQPVQPFGIDLIRHVGGDEGTSVFKQRVDGRGPFEGGHDVENVKAAGPEDKKGGDGKGEDIQPAADKPFAKIDGKIIWLPFYGRAAKFFFTSKDYSELVSHVVESGGALKLRAPEAKMLEGMQNTIDMVRKSLASLGVSQTRIRHEGLVTRHAEWLELQQLMRAVAEYQATTAGEYNTVGLFAGNLRNAITKALMDTVGKMDGKTSSAMKRGLEGAEVGNPGASKKQQKSAEADSREPYNPFQIKEGMLQSRHVTLPKFF